MVLAVLIEILLAQIEFLSGNKDTSMSRIWMTSRYPTPAVPYRVLRTLTNLIQQNPYVL